MNNVRIALVTGASRGIGKAIALNLASTGIVVIGTATTEGGADAITKFMHDAGFSNCTGYRLNITDDLDVLQHQFQDITTRFGEPNILVNNAGITADNIFIRMKADEWNRVIDTNLTGVYKITQLCVKIMMKQRFGRIINITSVVAQSGNPGQANYCAAKAGLIGFTKSLAQELASRSITVNAVAPGFIATDMTDELNATQTNALLERIPMKRMGQANDIANVVTFLASDMASYITGDTINVNGGLFMY